MKFIKIAQNVKKLTLAFCAVLFLLPACKTPPSDPSDTSFSAAREGENTAAESADKAGEPQPLDRIVRAEPQVESLNAENGSDRLTVSEPAPASEVKPAERIESESEKKKNTESAKKIEPAVKIVRASNTSAQASTPVPAQPPAREKSATSVEIANVSENTSSVQPAIGSNGSTNTRSDDTQTSVQLASADTPESEVQVVPSAPPAVTAGSAAQTPAQAVAQIPSSPSIISRTDASPAQTSADTASTPAVRSDSTPARVTPAQTSANSGTARIQAENTPSVQSAAVQTQTTAAGTKRAESADLSAESGFGLSSEPEVELASEDGSGSSSETAVPAIVPRRSVNAKINQFIDIPYSGRKWIFLGETEATSPPVVRFVNRTFSGDDTLFSVQAKNPGKTVLHFYRQDALENTYIDDYVAVEVLDEKAAGTNEHVRAAEIAFGKSASAEDAASSPAAAGLSNASSAGEGERTVSAASQTAVAKVSAAAAGVSAAGVETDSDATQKKSAEAEQLYAAAQKAFEEKRYEDSLTSLQEYEAVAGEDSDKALILRARLYESDSEKRNIKAALEAYEKIVNFFPESVFWDEAKRRSTYLRRFYFDIR